MSPLDALPGYRRSFVIVPEPGRCTAALEDDYHCMAVTLHHSAGVVTAVEPVMQRRPWTTCPGAVAVLERTFTGVPLDEAAGQGMKQANCTHLYDLAVLAAAHAGEAVPTRYDLLVADAIEGLIEAEIRRDGVPVLRWAHRDDVLVSPAEVVGTSLFKLRGWIGSLPPAEREAARLLQWATLIAHGRAIPMERQSDATRMPANCFTFQPGRSEHAVRVGEVVDFSTPGARPILEPLKL